MAKSLKDIRKQLDEILDRAHKDESFGKQLNADPEGVLRKEGFESRAVGEVSEEIKQLAQGKRSESDYERIIPNLDCDYTTCWISWCNVWATTARILLRMLSAETVSLATRADTVEG